MSKQPEISAISAFLETYLVPLWQLPLGRQAVCCRGQGSVIQVSINLGTPADSIEQLLIPQIEQSLSAKWPDTMFDVTCENQMHDWQAAHALPSVPGVKCILAIASAKGGVGKSATTLGLAYALRDQGAHVGILDADIYGPSLPTMLGTTHERLTQDSSGRLLPITAHGLQSMSIGYWVESGTPMVWRGPMMTKALQQLLYDTAWDNLDYLLLDLPPGTGDLPLTLAQKVPVNGAMIVTTPQKMAVADTSRGLQMLQKVRIPLLGVIENMSYYQCSECQHPLPLFAGQGGAELAQANQLPLLGKIAFMPELAAALDQGVAPDKTMIDEIYKDVLLSLIGKLACQRTSTKRPFPEIIVETTT